MNPELRIDRLIASTAKAVWDAWTTEAGLARWWWAGWDDTVYEVDLRVGGSYRITAPTAGIAVGGEYLELDPLRRISMTWVWSDADGVGPVEHVVVELQPDGSSTNVRVHHTGPWTSAETASNYLEGWHHVLDRLAEHSG
jgi:uncharacterized protein YndB with AHSA1/START domain